MYWEVIYNERSPLKEYRLTDNNDCKLTIKYNPLHQSARITCGGHHRLFFLETAGSMSGKTTFKNEYGMEIGNLVQDKFHPQDGTLTIETKKYQYQVQQNPAPQLIVFEGHHQKPVANCTIPAKKASIQTIFSQDPPIDNKCYLLGLCWYLFLPSVKDNKLTYAFAGF